MCSVVGVSSSSFSTAQEYVFRASIISWAGMSFMSVWVGIFVPVMRFVARSMPIAMPLLVGVFGVSVIMVMSSMGVLSCSMISMCRVLGCMFMCFSRGRFVG